MRDHGAGPGLIGHCDKIRIEPFKPPGLVH